MKLLSLEKLLRENTYPGRGIVIGASEDGKNAMIAYFIMGRSENSRNRIFERTESGLRTAAFDPAKLSDPSLVIYHPYLARENIDIITNGDQTDTIYRFLEEQKTFEEALATREFEPDAPNYTPRISGIAYYCFPRSVFTYKLAIIKSAGGNPASCRRFFYHYPPIPGVGHFLHTYRCDGNPIPSFEGEPEEVALPNSADELCGLIWENLNPDNKVSLFVRAVPLDGSEPVERIRNKNQ